MENKRERNVEVCTMVSFFLVGLPYTGGILRGLIALVLLTVFAIGAWFVTAAPVVSCAANLIGAYLGYKWTREYNKSLTDEQKG